MLEITVWDVSHGSAVWVKLPNGNNMVVDLGADGSGDQVFSPLRLMKSAYGVQHVDYVAITHGHADHLDDIFRLHQLYYPSVLWTPRHLSDDVIRACNQTGDMTLVDRYLLVRQQYSSPVPLNLDATIAANTGDAHCQFFIPSQCSKQNLNNHSLVVVISYQGMTVVIPGDNEAPSWNKLMENPHFRLAVRNTTVLMAPHHGREAGFCSELLDLMNPNLVVISDGDECDTSATNRYSAKAQGCRVANRIGKVEIRKCLTTRKDGHITIKFGLNGLVPSFWVSTSKPLQALTPPPFFNGLRASR